MHHKGCRGSGKTGRAPEPPPCTKAVGNSLAVGGLRGADGKGLLRGAFAARGHSQEGKVLFVPQFPSW